MKPKGRDAGAPPTSGFRTDRGDRPLPDHPNVKLVLAAWEAAGRSDVDQIAELCSPDIVWHSTGRSPWSGDHRGLKSAFEHLAQIGEAAELFSSSVQDVLVNHDRVILLFHVSGRLGKRRLETDYFLLFEIADGRIVEVWAVPRDQYAVDAFWEGVKAPSP